MISASAPGKLVLTGEYAVLTGAPAIVTAVDRRAVARLRPAAACRVEARGFEAAPAGFDYDATGALHPHDPAAADRYALVAAVLETLADGSSLPPGRAFELSLDTGAFHEDGSKLGLGSSAALTVAALAVLCRHFGIRFRPGLAFAAHRRFQGGAGSGLDVAAATEGGLIRFRAGCKEPAQASLRWPAGVQMACVWTGRSAATAPRVRRFESWCGSPGSATLRAALAEAAGRAADAWQAGASESVIAATAAWSEMLRRLAESAQIDIWSGGHDRLARLAEEAGVVYKPSGAGGGDIGLALSGAPAKLADFVSAAAGAGFRALTLGPDARGVATVE